jgi:alkanesulfonate monooxygenase SsuD/methylene tetrahydromethanopterin reductase-like flavin-dependent oxidoreductase (luciferase family)
LALDWCLDQSCVIGLRKLNALALMSFSPATIATLDHFFSGRALLGIGVGREFQPEYEACGIPLRERGTRA